MARLAKAGKVRAAVDEDGKIYCPLDIHGLRHARGVQLAHAGNSDAQIMAQFAHSTPAAAIKYRRQAERRKLADAAQDMVDNVTKLRTKKKTKNKEPSTAAD
jgi:integrase